jgi:hypothetical protein
MRLKIKQELEGVTQQVGGSILTTHCHTAIGRPRDGRGGGVASCILGIGVHPKLCVVEEGEPLESKAHPVSWFAGLDVGLHQAADSRSVCTVLQAQQRSDAMPKPWEC